MKSLFAKLIGVSSAVLNFYLPILRRLLASGMASLLPLALDIVRELSTSSISGNEKFSLAVGRLRDVAVARGIDAGESLIRYTIESAVQKMKDE